MEVSCGQEPASKSDHGTKSTKNTQSWWQALTGWPADEFAARRKAVMRRLREKWPANSKLNNKKLEVRQWLFPLIASFNDSTWPTDAPPHERFDRQLSHYTSWALYLNRTFDVPAATLVTPPAVKVPSYSFVHSDSVTPVRTRHASANTIQPSDYWSPSTDESETRSAELKSEQPFTESASETKPGLQAFKWDNMEVKIDALAFGLGVVWLPMIDLKPEPKTRSCHWADFQLGELYKQFSADTGYSIKPETHEFVYVSDQEDFPFFREGAYKVALRRFLQSAAVSHVMALRVQLRTILAEQMTKSPRTPLSSAFRAVDRTHPPMLLDKPSHASDVRQSQHSSTLNRAHRFLAVPQKRHALDAESADHTFNLNGSTNTNKRPRLTNGAEDEESQASQSKGALDRDRQASASRLTIGPITPREETARTDRAAERFLFPESEDGSREEQLAYTNVKTEQP